MSRHDPDQPRQRAPVPWVRAVALANPASVPPGDSGGSVAGRGLNRNLLLAH